MKIIHLCNYFQPRLGYQEYFLAREHARSGHDVTVITSDRYFPFPDYDNTVRKILGDRLIKSETSELDGFKIIRLMTVFEYSARVLLAGLSGTVRSIKPDIVICHGMATFNSQIIIDLKKRLGFRLVYDDHMLSAVENKSIAAKMFYKFYDFGRIMKYGDKLIAVADECVEFMKKNYKIPREKIEMIPLGADTGRFEYNEELRNEFRKNHSIGNDSVVITYTGKLTFDKAPHNIFLSLETIRNRITKKITVLLVGNMEKSYADFYEIKRNAVRDWIDVIELPMMDNSGLPSVYSASDIAVWPIQPTASMIEAASCGLPIIGSDTLKERYKNDNGIPVMKNDIEGLAEALLTLVNDGALRRKMGKNGRDLIEKEMSWRIIAERFISFAGGQHG
jgi:glycosyltransferase involved in cell wall biosynthesis